MAEAKIGVIGGSGLYKIEGLSGVEELKVKTPFGDPSDVITVGKLEGVPVAFLPRHGRGHRLSPTEVPSRANIFAMKTLGVERIIAVSAVGSLKQNIKPMDIVIPNQIIDRTRNRINTFFGNGLVVHIAFAKPFCPSLSSVLCESAKKVKASVHNGGTCVVMEGPQFSTRAESELYRSWNADVIYMTGLPEAKLAREAEICYATIAIVTDYDCWNDSTESVTTEMVVANLMKATVTAKDIVKVATKNLPSERDCLCTKALENAIITAPEFIPEKAKIELKPIIGKYIK